MSGITHNDIGTDRTDHWGTPEWYTMVYKPIYRLDAQNVYGPLLQFIQYLPHAQRAIGLTNQIRQILHKRRIGYTSTNLDMFLQHDLPAANKCNKGDITTPQTEAQSRCERARAAITKRYSIAEHK
jgi:hypothetical protein